jgi:hypothetical protein
MLEFIFLSFHLHPQVREESCLQLEEVQDFRWSPGKQHVSDLRRVIKDENNLKKHFYCSLKAQITIIAFVMYSLPRARSGLKNDNTPETFELKHKMYSDEGERDIPILYVQIVPLLSYGPSFNFSIWYVELQGIEDVFEGLYFFNEQREKQAIRLILKHLRDKGYTKAFKELEREAKINLEDNQITELFQCLVEEGNFEKAETIMEQFIESEYNRMSYEMIK